MSNLLPGNKVNKLVQLNKALNVLDFIAGNWKGKDKEPILTAAEELLAAAKQEFDNSKGDDKAVEIYLEKIAKIQKAVDAKIDEKYEGSSEKSKKNIDEARKVCDNWQGAAKGQLKELEKYGKGANSDWAELQARYEQAKTPKDFIEVRDQAEKVVAQKEAKAMLNKLGEYGREPGSRWEKLNDLYYNEAKTPEQFRDLRDKAEKIVAQKAAGQQEAHVKAGSPGPSQHIAPRPEENAIRRQDHLKNKEAAIAGHDQAKWKELQQIAKDKDNFHKPGEGIAGSGEFVKDVMEIKALARKENPDKGDVSRLHDLMDKHADKLSPAAKDQYNQFKDNEIEGYKGLQWKDLSREVRNEVRKGPSPGG